MPSRKGQPQVANRVRRYIMEHPEATIDQVMEVTGCGRRTVSYHRSKLVKSGLVQPAYYARKFVQDNKLAAAISAKTKREAQLQSEGADALVAALAKVQTKLGEPLTVEESLQMLATFARTAQAEGKFPLAKDAVIAHARLSERTQGVALGPGDPLTPEDILLRMTNLCDVVGPLVTAAAAVAAFPNEADRRAYEEEVARLSATHPPLPPLGGTLDTGAHDEADDPSPQALPQTEIDYTERTPDGP